MVRHARLKYGAKHINFIVEILQLIEERGVFLFDLSHVDGVSDLWWQSIVLLGFPVGVIRNSTILTTVIEATRGRAGKAIDINISVQAILIISS